MKNLLKKIVSVGAFAFLGLTSAFAQIQFAEGTWEEVQAKAKKENKHIFVDAYAEWCGPCKAMAKNVFTAKEVGDFYNQNFVSYKFDMEKGEGPKFAQNYQVQAYPTLMYFSPKGELVHKALGGRANDGFVELGKSAINPATQYYTLRKKMENSTPDKETLAKFMVAAKEAGDEEGVKKVSLNVAKSMKEKDWTTSLENAQIVFQAMAVDEKIYEKALKMRPQFEKIAGKEMFNNAVLNKFQAPFTEVVKSKNEKGLKELHDKVDKTFPKEDTQMIHLRLDYAYYMNTGNQAKGQEIKEKMDALKAKK